MGFTVNSKRRITQVLKVRLADSYLNSFTSVGKRTTDFFLIQILIVKRHGKMPMLILFWVRLPLVFA